MIHWQDILAIFLVTGAAWYLVRFMVRSLRGSGGCHCSGDISCGAAAKSSDVNSVGIRRIAFVPIDQLGTDTPPTEPPSST